MIYVLDTTSISVMQNYYSDSFPSFWTKMDKTVSLGEVVSVREVFNELDRWSGVPQNLETWVKKNKSLFAKPTAAELTFVKNIFSVKHFEQLVSAENRLKGTPSADPFIIAAAKVRNGCVITEEKEKSNAAKDTECVQTFRY